MRILYLANVRLPTEKAHGLQIMEMASALAKGGAEIELVVPRRTNHLEGDPFDYYDIEPTFPIVRVFALDLSRTGRAGYRLATWSFALAALVRHLRKGGIAYTRDAEIAALLALFGRSYVYEPHIGKWNPIVRMAMRGALLILPITRGLSEFFAEKGVPEGRMVVLPDGVNLERFSIDSTKEECRERLGLPQDKRIVLYAGHLYKRKGPQYLAEAARSFDDDTIAYFVGGNPADVQAFAASYGDDPHIAILGHRPHDEIPYFLRAADALVLPNSARSDDSRLYTSPMKLFEYMASGTSIVAADVPSLREVLDENSAEWADPDDAGSLLEAILRSFDTSRQGQKRSQDASAIVARFDWSERAKTTINEISSRL